MAPHETCATFPTRFAREKDAFLPSRRPVGVAATDEGPVGTIGSLLALRTTRLPVLGLRRRINDNVLGPEILLPMGSVKLGN